MFHRSRVSFTVLLSCCAAGLPAQAPDRALDQQPPAIALTGLAGLQPWESGLRGFGDDYRVLFTTDGVRFLPDLLESPADIPLQLTLHSVMRGTQNVVEVLPVEPRRDDLAVDYERAPGVREHYDVTADHVELSWIFDERPQGRGDLVVRYAIDTELPTPTPREGGGLQFVREGIGGVQIGGVTGIDADGDTVSGSITLVDGDLELRLPASFVDEAAYPLVLDPAIGTVQTWTDGTKDRLTDAAYDRSTGLFLFVYLKEIGLLRHEARGIYRQPNGILSNSFALAVGDRSAPRVANLSAAGTFGITWVRGQGIHRYVEFLSLPAGSQQTSPAITVAHAPNQYLGYPDIGADTNAPAGSGRGFVIVYDDGTAGRIEARRVYFSSNGQPVMPPAITVLQDSTMISIDYSEPRISNTAAHAGDLLMVAKVEAQSLIQGVACRIVRSDSPVVGPGRNFQTFGVNARHPAVDGFDGQWVVAWSQGSATLTTRSIEIRSLTSSGISLDLVQSNAIDLGDIFERPHVAYTPGRTWVAFSGSVGGRVRAIDSRSCADCQDHFRTQRRPDVMVTTMSGNFAAGEVGFVGWSDTLDMNLQQARNYGFNSNTANLGGGCGNGGTISLSHDAGIGSAGVQCRVDGLPSTAMLTVFNFALPQLPITCGTCSWSPFMVTTRPPIVNGSAMAEFPIPCLTWLIGAQFETQWTTFDPTQTACSLYPGLLLSDRLLLTVSN